jgi:hypothetical protein
MVRWRYKSGTQREAVAKAAQTRLYRNVDTADGRQIVNQFYGRSGSRARSKRWPLTREAAERFRVNRERKLAGEWLPDGDWHEMIQIAENFHDERLAILRQSPGASMNIGK